MESNFFLVGCPRSGTTLLQAMMNRHSNLLIPPESKIFSAFHNAPSWIRRKTIRRINSDMGLELDFRFAMPTANTVATVDELHRQFAIRTGRRGVSHFGDKTPEHTSRISTIRDVFPNAPIIAIVREGYAVSESLTCVPWLRCDFRGAGVIWRHYMEYISNAIDHGVSNFHIVRYEDLVREPIRVLTNVFQSIEVEPGDVRRCLIPNPDRDRWLFPVREKSWKRQAIDPIDLSKLRMPSDVSEDQRRQIRSACGAMLSRWGYDDGVDLERGFLDRSCEWTQNLISTTRTLMGLPPSVLVSEGLHHMRHWWRALV